MSFAKGLALTFFSILLVVFLVLFQADNTLSNTVLSSGYFNGKLEKNATPESIESFAEYLKGNTGISGNDNLKKIIQDAIDVQWLQKDAPAFLKSCFAYFTTGEGKLPAISIKPMKDALGKAITSQAGVGSVMVASQLGLNDMKDTFDLNQFVGKLYGNSSNPVAGLGDVLAGTRSFFFLLFAIVALLLFAIIAVIAYSPRSILKWGGMCLLIAGAFCALCALVPMVFNGAINTQVAVAVGSDSQPDLLFLQNFVMAFAGGVATFMLLQGLAVAAIGVGFLVAAGFVNRGGVTPASSGHTAIRAAAALVLAAAIPFSAFFIGRNYYTEHVKEFTTVQKMHEKMTTGEAFDATVGGHLGKTIEQLTDKKK